MSRKKQHESPSDDCKNKLIVALYNSERKVKNCDLKIDYEILNPIATKIDHDWSKRILELVGNKAKLMESFSWLSTVGGGFSALGERDTKFSIKAGSLSLGQQLNLAEKLRDDRLKVMCHLFAALAAIQLDNKQFCVNYLKRVIIPMIRNLPYREPILSNMLRHICFRLHRSEKFIRVNALEDTRDRDI